MLWFGVEVPSMFAYDLRQPPRLNNQKAGERDRELISLGQVEKAVHVFHSINNKFDQIYAETVLISSAKIKLI